MSCSFVELLKLQQHCIDLDRAVWPDTLKTDSEGVLKIPYDLWVKMDEQLGVYVTVPAGKRWLPRQATAAHVFGPSLVGVARPLTTAMVNSFHTPTIYFVLFSSQDDRWRSVALT